MNNSDVDRYFTYEFRPNIDTFQYTTKIGLTIDEAMLVSGAGGLPFVVTQNLTGAVIGVMAAALAFMAIKKFDRFGGVSFFLYLLRRIAHQFKNRTVQVNQIVPSISGTAITYLDQNRHVLYKTGEAQ